MEMMKIKSNLILTMENNYAKADFDVITNEIVFQINEKIRKLLKIKDEKN